MGKKVKYAAMATLAGTLLGGGCLGGLPWQQLLWVTAIQQAAEFALDNDGVFDLWEDGGVAPAAN
jgi:hypothetical protein